MKKSFFLFLILFISNQLFAQDSLKKYLEQNLKYPALASRHNVYGTSILYIKLNKKGELLNYDIDKKLGNGIGINIVNTITEIKNWKPLFDNLDKTTSIKIPIKYIHENHYIDSQLFQKITLDTIYKKPKIIDTFIETDPVFLGDNINYIFNKNLKFPNLVGEIFTSGTIIIDFMINSTGTISNTKIKKGIGDGFDEEALRIIGLLNKWKPATQNGKAVNLLISYPFDLNVSESIDLSIYKNQLSIDTIKIFNKLEYEPIYTGGSNKFKNDLSDLIQINYKKISDKKSGYIEAVFTVDLEGSISEIYILNSINEEYDNAVKSALKSLPKFKFVTPNKTPTTYTIVIPFE